MANELKIKTDFPDDARIFIASFDFDEKTAKSILFNEILNGREIFKIPENFDTILVRVRHKDYYPIEIKLEMDKKTWINIPSVIYSCGTEGFIECK